MQSWNAWWHGSATAIPLELDASPTARWLSLGACALSLAVILLGIVQRMIPWWFVILLAMPLMLELRRHLGSRPKEIHVFPEKQKLEVHFYGRIEVLFLHDWWCHPWLIAIWARPPGARLPGRVILVWHDAVPRGVHRALRRWLRQLAFQGTGTTGSG